MAFPSGGQGDQRRRRVLIEEKIAGATAPKERPPATAGERRHTPGAAVAYAVAALADRQPPITVLIPRRAWTVAVLALTGLTIIAGLEAAYANLLLWPREMWLSACRSLDLNARGELASVFSLFLLAAAAVQSLLVFRLRRHRTDDYRGRYRLWGWIPVVWLAMAVGASTHVVDDLLELGGALSGLDCSQAKTFWLPLSLCGMWLLIAARLAVEVRRSWASLTFLVVATLSYAAAGLQAAGFLHLPNDVLCVLATSLAAMLGHLASFLAMAAYGRFVFLEAHGLLAAQVRSQAAGKRKKAQATGKTASSAKPARTNTGEPSDAPADKHAKAASPDTPLPATAARSPALDAARPKPAAAPAAPSATPSKPIPGQPSAARAPVLDREDDEDDDADGEHGGSNLSRAERRRLRKLGRRDPQQQQRRAA
jgi:hypothetical protein